MAAIAPPPGPLPVPLECILDWNYQPETIPEDPKLRAFIRILKPMKMASMDLVTTILARTDTFRPNIDGFYCGTTLEQFLNLVKRDKRGRARLSIWFEQGSMDSLIQDIHREMDDLSTISLSRLISCFRLTTPEIVTLIQAQIAKTRSQNNNLCVIPCSLYFYSSGMPKTVVDTLAHAGLCLSWNATKDLHSQLAVRQIRRA
ncbi:hypothetical protein C8R45DRAFT_1102971 [Mycena sanguinolenta]|nr:hypothetical protein C8R45DRAFT_1102971 [Mycena sanguinolenta]